MKSFRSGIYIILIAAMVLLWTSLSSYSLTPWDHLRLGVDVSYFDYEEPGVMQETGLMGGVYGSYRLDYWDPITFDGYGSLVFGSLDYDGAIAFGDGRSEDISLNTSSMIFDLRGTSGMKLRASNHMWTPYIGLGYRYMEDDLPTVYGYIREQSYYYIPLGVTLMFATKYGWRFEGSIEYDLFLEGRNRSHGGAIGRGVTVIQDSGEGARASLNLILPMQLYPNYSVGFNIEPFVEYWNIDASNVVNGYYEPKNESTMYGVRFGMEF